MPLCRHNPKPMIGLLTDSFQLATPDPRQGPVCGNDTIVKGRLCTPPELDIYYRVLASATYGIHSWRQCAAVSAVPGLH